MCVAYSPSLLLEAIPSPPLARADNFEDAASAVGNSFMELASGYMATHPTAPVAGNHERCTACPGIAGFGESNAYNFTECKLQGYAWWTRCSPLQTPQARASRPLQHPPTNPPHPNATDKIRFASVATHGAGAVSGTGTALYYSFEQGLTHFLVFSAEAYLYSRDAAFLANQLAFMRQDLAKVDRKQTPWVVALV